MSAPRDTHRHRRLDDRSHQGLVRRIAGLFGPYRLPVGIAGLLIVLSAGLGVLKPGANQGGLRLRPLPARRRA